MKGGTSLPGTSPAMDGTAGFAMASARAFAIAAARASLPTPVPVPTAGATLVAGCSRHRQHKFMRFAEGGLTAKRPTLQNLSPLSTTRWTTERSNTCLKYLGKTPCSAVMCGQHTHSTILESMARAR